MKLRNNTNWREAAAFCELIAGEADPVMCFQVFDDKKRHPEWAGCRHGRLSDPATRNWLEAKNNKGCGVYVCVNETDGTGRRRENVVRVRAHWADFDGNPLPTNWPVQPDMITESSPNRFQVFWLVEPYTDLNKGADTQARLAAYFGTDPTIIDPPRVCRLPGYDHHKRDPFRSRTVASIAPEDGRLDGFSRPDVDRVREAHAAEYDCASGPADPLRSQEPEAGWNNEADVARAREYLKTAMPSVEGEGGNATAYRHACVLNDLGISAELSLELMEEEWNARCEPPWSETELATIIRNAARYKQNAAGADSTGSDQFEPIRTASNAAGLQYKIATDIAPKKVTWLWPDRLPSGKLSLIAGFPEQGKSQICVSIAATVTTGGEWPNAEGMAEKGAVIILSSEDTADDTIVPRLKAAGADLDQVIILEPMVTEVRNGKKAERVLNIGDDLRRIEHMMDCERANGRDVKLIILDPINAYFGGKERADSHNASDMRALLTPISKWAGDRGVTVIGITHFNKGGNSHTLYRITDSGAITAVARAVWFAVRDQASERMMLLRGKSNIGPKIGGLAYDIEVENVGHGITAPRVAWDGPVNVTAEEALGQRKERKSDAVEEAMEFLSAMLEGGPVPAKQVHKEARAHSISAATVRRAKMELGIHSRRTGGLGKDGEWEWSLPSVADDFGDEEDDFG